jgi:hypothetical protein
MAGDPKQCREHAAQCKDLAAHTLDRRATAAFMDLAETWERLAAELESSQVFVRAMEQIGCRADGDLPYEMSRQDDDELTCAP